MNTSLPGNLRALATPSSKRSTFNLPDNIHQLIEELAKSLHVSMKDLFSELVTCAKPNFEPVASQGARSRKTYVLASDTLQKLSIYTQTHTMGRDDLIIALVHKFIEQLHKIANGLSFEKRIQAAQRIQYCAAKAWDEWNKCSEDRDLLEKYDAGFKFVAEYFRYIDQLNELPSYIEHYISKVKEVQSEADETCD